jgi:MFS family permease
MLLAHAVLVQAVVYVLRPATSYQALELGVPISWLGALGACFTLVPLIIAVPVGRLTDRHGERVSLYGGAGLLLGGALIFVLAGGTVAGLVIGNVALGAGHLFSMVGEQTLVANRSAPATRDHAFGTYTFAASLGQTLGPALIVVLGGSAAIPATGPIFLAALALTIGTAAITVQLRAPTTPHAARAADDRGGVATMLKVPGVGRALTVGVVVLVSVDVLTVYLPALGADRGLDSAAVGALLMLRSACSMISRLMLGRLVESLGRQRLLVASMLASAGALAVMPAPVPLPVLALVVALAGLGLGIGQPVVMSWLADAAPSGLRGTAMSLRLTGNRLGQTIMPTVVGLIAAGAGVAGVLWATAGLLAAAGASAGGTLSTGSTTGPRSRTLA